MWYVLYGRISSVYAYIYVSACILPFITSAHMFSYFNQFYIKVYAIMARSHYHESTAGETLQSWILRRSKIPESMWP